jgi:hypothetical protein
MRVDLEGNTVDFTAVDTVSAAVHIFWSLHRVTRQVATLGELFVTVL